LGLAAGDPGSEEREDEEEMINDDLSAAQRRILLELDGREEGITTLELCQALDRDPLTVQDDLISLRLNDLVEKYWRDATFNRITEQSNPLLRITAIGREQLQRSLARAREAEVETRRRAASVRAGRPVTVSLNPAMALATCVMVVICVLLLVSR
jgi:hypothetical protein